MLKMTDRKKEGNKLLRSLDLADGSTDNSEFTHDIQVLGYYYYNQGKLDLAKTIHQEASRLHLFLGPHQRPLLFVPDMESKPVWTVDLDGETDDGLTYLKKDIAELLGNWEIIKDEALQAGKNLSENWFSLGFMHYSTTLVTEPKDPEDGSWHTYPLYMWGKKKNGPCSLAPKTCGLLKKHFPDATKCATCTVKFIKLDPKVSVQPHCGPTNDRLRSYLGLSNSDKLKYVIEGGSPKEGQVVPLVDGKLKVVDESYAHAIKNTSDDVPVILLAIDFMHPNLPVK